MNKIESKFNFKTFITFLTVLVLSLSLAFATACKKSSSSDSESSSSPESSSAEETVVDEQTLKNGDFEFTSGKNTSKPNTATSWTVRSDGADEGYSTGTSSSYVLIDTEDSAFDALTSEYKHSYTETVDGKETTKYENPRTPFYNADAENKGLVDDDKTEANEAGTKVMMLRNKDYSAQYASSSTTLSVPSGEYAILSIWVKTLGVEHKYPGSKAGAYVKLKHNAVDVNNDNEAYEPLVVKNINTEGAWVKISIYLQPNQSRATSYTLVLGFGEGNSVYTENHVKGFAYFDCANFTLAKYSEFEDIVPDAPPATATSGTTVDAHGWTTSGKEYNVAYTLSKMAEHPFDVSINSTFEWNAVHPNTDGNKVEEDASKITVEENQVKIDFSSFGNIGSSYTHTTKVTNLNSKNYVRISFWAKVTTEDYQQGATLAIYDCLKGKVVASFDNVNTNDYENENTDNFVRYTFYVANNFVDSADAMSYQLKLTYGPTEKVDDPHALPTGVAIFKDFVIEELTEDEYKSADVTTDTNAKKVALTGSYANDYTEDDDEDDDTANDTYSTTVSGMEQVNLENGQIIPVEQISSLKDVLSVPNGAVFGLANSKYDIKDTQNAKINDALDVLKGKITNGNSNVQALVLNANGTETAISAKTVIVPKNSTYSFSIKVYAHEGNAFVRLVDVDKSTEENPHVVFVALKEKAVKTTVTKEDCARFEDGYAIVTYVITTGAEEFELKLEFGSNGVAVFDALNAGTLNSTYTSAEVLIDEFYVGVENLNVYTFDKETVTPKIYYYANVADVGNEDLRLKDEDGNPRVTDGVETIVYALGKAETATEYFVQYFRFDTDDLYEIDAGDEEITSEPDSSSDSESTSESVSETQNYGWLQVTSIIIALVLVAALVAVVIRKSFEGKARKKKNTEKYYHQGYDKSTRRTGKNDVAVPDAEDNAKDYDYDNPENN